MKNWNPGYNWTKEEFHNVVTKRLQEEGRTDACLDVEHSDRKNMDDIMHWAKEAGYFAEERCGGDTIYVSKVPPVDKNPVGSVPSEKTVAFFRKLLKLLAASTPQVDDCLVCSLDGEVIAEHRTMEKPSAEDGCLAEVLPHLKGKTSPYPETTEDGASREYWAIPFLTDKGGVCKYALVCHGRRDALNNGLPTFLFVAQMYMLR